MEIDKDKIDDTILALFYLTLDRDGRAWKVFDWSAMNRLHDEGFIDDPVNKAKTVWLTDEGIARSERLFREMFAVNACVSKPYNGCGGVTFLSAS